MKKGKVSPEFLQKIKDAVNIIEVVGEHVVLRKSGANYTGLCPFHQERSPSFSVSELKQLYHCYGCKKGGDLVSFVMEIHGITFPEAIEELAERGRVALPKDWGGGGSDNPEVDAKRAAAREKLNLAFKLNRFVAAFYHHSLAQQPAAREYFRHRGVPDEQVRSFYLGSSSSSWDALTQHLVAKKAPIAVAQELGLIRPSPKPMPNGPGFFDLFRNRVMFPILDLRGKVVGFGGRTMPSPKVEDTGDATGSSGAKADSGPKYMNSPESPIFHKSKIAYGLYQAQKFVREKDEVVLVEGYFDVIALHAAGFQNVVATCGTALTPDHLHLFKRFASKITVLFDGDRAGVSATERAMEIGLAHGVVLYGAAMPEGLDPDEILFDQETGKATPLGVAQMTAILESSRPLLDSQIQSAVKDSQSGAEARTQALKQIAVWLSMYTDPVGREIRIQDVQSQLGVSRALLDQAMGVKPSVVVGNQNQKFGQNIGNVGNNYPSNNFQRSDHKRDFTSGGQGYSQNRNAQKNYNSESGSFGGQQRQRGSYSTESDGPVQGPESVVVSGRGKKTVNVRAPSPGDRVLLQALALGGHFLEPFRESAGKLPPEMTIADLFDYLPARDFLSPFMTSAELAGGIPPGFVLDAASLSSAESDGQVRSILMEASVRGAVDSVTASVTSGGGLSAQDVRGAIHRGIRRVWARFSQQIIAAMQDAEAKKDAELHAKLSKEYLDVERKMKEFISFYDEA